MNTTTKLRNYSYIFRLKIRIYTYFCLVDSKIEVK